MGPRPLWTCYRRIMNLMIPTNIARLESLAKDIYEYKSQGGSAEEDVLKEPKPLNYGINFLELFLEIQTMLSMLNSLPDPALYEEEDDEDIRVH